jgi:carboxyl-terminal processing protease
MLQTIKKILTISTVISVCLLGLYLGRSFTSHFIGFQVTTALSESDGLASDDQKYKYLELFNRVLHFVRTNYVDPVSEKKLVEGAIRGMLSSLDPHSHFLSSEEFKDMQIDTSGKFGGLGIEITIKDNILTIVTVLENTPAWKEGLKVMDRIIKIDNETTDGMSLTEAVSKMRGKPKSSVQLTIYRKGVDANPVGQLKEIKIVRDIVKVQAVKFDVIEPKMGYVRLSTFNENAAFDLKKAIDAMIKSQHGLQGLVLDLRMNPGGLLDQAIEVTSLFLKEGIVVSTIGRDKNQKEVRVVHKGMAYPYIPMAVLVDSTTASAAEIVAGALQDHKRAVIMGQPTFGKGSVQTVSPLPPDMGLKLTIARYYTPLGNSIQEKGVKPDILLDRYDSKLLAKAKLKLEVFREIREKDLKGHMSNPQESDSNNKGQSAQVTDKKANSKEDATSTMLNSLAKKKDDKEEDDAPTPYNPKEDHQVQTAINVLKGFSIFEEINKKNMPEN